MMVAADYNFLCNNKTRLHKLHYNKMNLIVCFFCFVSAFDVLFADAISGSSDLDNYEVSSYKATINPELIDPSSFQPLLHALVYCIIFPFHPPKRAHTQHTQILIVPLICHAKPRHVRYTVYIEYTSLKRCILLFLSVFVAACRYVFFVM